MWGNPARRSAARSAIVRATRHAFPIALPDRESRSAARVRNAAASGVSSRNSSAVPERTVPFVREPRPAYRAS